MIAIGYLQLDCGIPTKIKGWRMFPAFDAQNPQYLALPKNFVIEASNDGETFDTVYTSDSFSDYDPATFTYRECMFASIVNYRYYRIRTTGANYQDTYHMLIADIQFYRPVQSEVTV